MIEKAPAIWWELFKMGFRNNVTDSTAVLGFELSKAVTCFRKIMLLYFPDAHVRVAKDGMYRISPPANIGNIHSRAETLC